jgi:hypothetical protein
MAIREVVQPAPQAGSLKHRLNRVIVSDDDIHAVWVIEKNGKRYERSVQVSPALTAQIMARPVVQTVLDQIKDDTYPRTGA